MTSMNHIYHKKCFTCKECLRPMDQFLACDAPDGIVYIVFFYVLNSEFWPGLFRGGGVSSVLPKEV
jgi:hypothetical protein